MATTIENTYKKFCGLAGAVEELRELIIKRELKTAASVAQSLYNQSEHLVASLEYLADQADADEARQNK